MLTLWCAASCVDHKQLSTISSIQSEMEQRFGALTKRSAKARAYQDVLSSCQFRVKRLRYDLEVLARKINRKYINEIM